MWSYFRSKAALAERLAVERTRRESAEAELARERTRLERAELTLARLQDGLLLKQGAITAPVRVEPAPPANPLVGAMASLGLAEYDGKPRDRVEPTSWPPMPDE